MRKAVHLFGRALRETGQAVDRLGLVIGEKEIFNETYARHRNVMNLYDKRPVVAAGTFVAPNATVVGEVMLLNDVSIWYGAVVRGDKSRVRINSFSNIQDRAVVSTTTSDDSGFSSDVVIGEHVTVGHGALITSSVIGDYTLIGQGAVIQEGCDVGSNVIVAAGAVVLPGTAIPSGELWAGNPAKFIRKVTDQEIAGFEKSSTVYSDLAKEHDAEFLPYGTVYQHAEALKVQK